MYNAHGLREQHRGDRRRPEPERQSVCDSRPHRTLPTDVEHVLLCQWSWFRSASCVRICFRALSGGPSKRSMDDWCFIMVRHYRCKDTWTPNSLGDWYHLMCRPEVGWSAPSWSEEIHLCDSQIILKPPEEPHLSPFSGLESSWLIGILLILLSPFPGFTSRVTFDQGFLKTNYKRVQWGLDGIFQLHRLAYGDVHTYVFDFMRGFTGGIRYLCISYPYSPLLWRDDTMCIEKNKYRCCACLLDRWHPKLVTTWA